MAEAAATTSAEVAAPKKKAPWLIIAIVFFALAAGGAGAYFFFGSEGDAQTAEDGKSAEAKSKKPKEPAQYVKLEPPFVVNFEAKGLMRFLQVTVEVMTRDPATLDVIKQNDPMIRNDLIMLFGNQTYETISTREGKEALRAEALKVVARVVDAEGGDGSKIEQLFFTSFVMQ